MAKIKSMEENEGTNGGGVQVLNLAEFRVTFSVGAERIVRKENGVTRQKIQEKFPRGEVVQRSVGITLPRLFNPIDGTRFLPHSCRSFYAANIVSRP